jgi:transposase-like protein
MAKYAKCPNCKSINIEPVGENKKGFSVGKAIVGGVLTGGIGTLAGFVGKKKGYDFICKDCGRIFTVKK